MPAALWDMDGTLVDTAAEHFAAWRQLAAEQNWPYSRADFDRTFGWRNPEIFRTLFDADLSDAELARLADRKETLYREQVRRDGVQLLPGVARLVREFEDANWKQAIGSSAPMGNLELLLTAAGVAERFAVVVSGDDVTRGKPDPEVFVLGAKRLGVSPRECVVFEDAVAGVEAARAAGMACVAVRSGHHHSADSLYAAGANLVVDSLESIKVSAVSNLIRPG